MTQAGHAAELVGFVASYQPAAIPAEVAHHARRALVDHLAVTLAGSMDPASVMARQVVASIDAATTAPVVGTGMRASAPFAAFLNAFASHVLDLDDVYNPPGTTVHGSCSVWPTIFSMAHLTTVSGARALTGFALGFEVETRMAHAAGSTHYDAGWHVTGTSGHVGAAAAAAYVLGLDEVATQHAMGAGATQAAGLRAMAGSDLKSLHPGKAAQDGVMSALFAQSGLTASPDALDGRYGYLDVMSDGPEPTFLSHALGEDWRLLDNGHKLYPSGSLTHPLVDGVISLVMEHDIAPADVAAVTANVSGPAARFTDVREPENAMQAKFSLTHCAAAAATYRRLGVAELSAEALQNHELVRLRDHVQVVTSPGLGKQDALVEITLTDGRELLREIRGNRGTPSSPLGDEDLEAKFRVLVEPLLGAARSQTLLSTCWRIDELDDVTELLELTLKEDA